MKQNLTKRLIRFSIYLWWHIMYVLYVPFINHPNHLKVLLEFTEQLLLCLLCCHPPLIPTDLVHMVVVDPVKVSCWTPCPRVLEVLQEVCVGHKAIVEVESGA